MKSILDPSFRYTPSTATDVRKTFARIRRELQRAQAQTARRETEAPRVVPIQRPPPQTAASRR